MVLPNILIRIVGRLLRRRLPDRWRVPFAYHLHLRSRECEPELRHLERICRGRDVAVDVGANYGYYTYRMSQLFEKVYAFEANPALVEVLRTFQNPRLHVVPKGLSSRSGVSVLHIPVHRGRPLLGWGSLDPEDLAGHGERLHCEIETTTLDELDIQPVSLLKIDVEGHEVEVLRGARCTLAACRPVVIIEVRERNAREVRHLLGRLGYAEARLEDLAGVPGSAQNLIFVPPDAATHGAGIAPGPQGR